MKRYTIRWLVLMLFCLAFLFGSAMAARADGLEVHFINVGRNDGILIRCGGEDVFLDSGTYEWGQPCVDYMKSVGVRSLKYYIGTHAHRDHVGGAPVVLAAFQTGAVLEPHRTVETAMQVCAKTDAEKAAVKNARYEVLTAGQSVQIGDATLSCLGPLHITPANYRSTAENVNSLVLMLTYGQNRFLLTGDATAASMRAIEAAHPGSLRADVYKNAHHNGETRKDLVAAISPKYTVISTDSSHMPTNKYLELLGDHGSKILITTENHSGNIVMTSDGKNIQVRTQYKASSISLDKTTLDLYEGQTSSLKASIQPSGRGKGILFTSDDPSIASVTSKGKVTGLCAGETFIHATDANGLSARCKVTVQPATLVLRKSEVSLRQHSTTSVSWSIRPSGSKKPAIRWASLNPDVASVNGSGKITGVYPGTAIITATMPNGQESRLTVEVKPIPVSSISVKPSSLKLTLGDTRKLTAKASPSKATWKEVAWSSADETIARVSSDGTVTAAGVGQTTITASVKDGKTRAVKVTVKPIYVKKIALSAAPAGLVAGVTGKNQAQMTCSIQPSNATIQSVRWTSSNNKVLTVDKNGVLTAHAAGKAYITCRATDGSGRYAKVRVTVAKNELNRPGIRPTANQLTTCVRRMRYTGNVLEVKMDFMNQSGSPKVIPNGGSLVVITPSGERISALRLEAGTALRHRSTRSLTFRVPLTDRLSGLDLTDCDAVIAP